ncbi:MAG: alpha-D-glucose phosphate-specific phosphoglucomutase [Burkholderiales bacterium]|nr:alpha-D-glucose phosphate-specific phosphoglucomutase [Burkholderiales bacterium]
MPTIQISRFTGQVPGTSGLRKKVAVFQQPGYVESFIQAIFNGVEGLRGTTLIVGGDGRYGNDQATRTVLQIAAANGVARVVTGLNGLLSTPAASHLIRLRGAAGGIILSASHNPGGPDGDMGIKFNGANGGPATETVTAAIAAAAASLDAYQITDDDAPALDVLGTYALGGMIVEVVDPVADYAALMATRVDFDAIRRWIAAGHRIRIDAMHAVAGPYATHIFETLLGAPAGSVINATPSPDFAGGHPDPNPVYAAALVEEMSRANAPDFAAAFDGDADRNMILGAGMVLTPSDSLAILAAHARLLPQFREGLPGVARSMPTSRAVDVVAAAMGFPCFETPTGWKFFGNLLDAGRIGLCGEESYGTGGDHVREKDGVWTALCWLNLLAVLDQPVAEIVKAHWARFGRHYYSRHDYEALPQEAGEAVMQRLRAEIDTLAGTSVGTLRVAAASDFAYTDPIDGSTSLRQGVCIAFDGGARAVFRLSGTGTEGATLRVYLERFEPNTAAHGQPTQDALAPVAVAARSLAAIEALTGRTMPDVVT